MSSKGPPRGEKLIDAWIRQLVAAALGQSVTCYLVARDAVAIMQPLDKDESSATLNTLLTYWRKGLNRPLPTACKTALELINIGKPDLVYDGGYDNIPPPEVADLCLARLWPCYADLSANPDFEDCSQQLYGPLNAWLTSKVLIQPIMPTEDVQ